MRYSDINDFHSEFSDEELVLLTDGTLPNLYNTARMEMATDKVASMIDNKLKGKFSVPFIEPPPFLIRKIAYELIVNNLYEMNERNTAMPSTVLRRKAEALNMLEDLAMGNIQLYDDDYDGILPTTIISNKTNSEREFSSEKLDDLL
jgi:phage gp36-like protein